jgi:hypothetical protein
METLKIINTIISVILVVRAYGVGGVLKNLTALIVSGKKEG